MWRFEVQRNQTGWHAKIPPAIGAPSAQPRRDGCSLGNRYRVPSLEGTVESALGLVETRLHFVGPVYP
jgi:hypothetical protein